ncbi:MAG TPA: M28 family peptidase [Chitinophagales bacterium]|nr:M28 family peptidase [Chitinophagales bacterium]
MKSAIPILTMLVSLSTFAQNQVPQISNVNISFSGATATINYTLSDTENDNIEVYFLVSDDNGKNFISKAGTVSGDIGYPVQPNGNKQITWNTDTISNLASYAFKIVADDRQVPSIQSIVDAVDSNLLHNDLQFVTGNRNHITNPTHLEAVKDSIENRYKAYGLATYRQDFMRDNYLGQNIIGKKAGLASEEKTLIIDAHFDSVEDAPGADDNGSGTVGVWEALRVLAPYNFKKTIKFIGFDFEESVGGSGTWGSYLYAQSQIPTWEKILGVATFEMIGYYTEAVNSQQVPTGFNLLYPNQYNQLAQDSFRGNFIISVGADSSDRFVKDFDTLTKQYVPDLKIISFTLPGKGTISPDFRRSDHAHFWDKNIPALMITDGANFRNHNYHTTTDDISTINFTFMSRVVKATVATIATLAELQHSSYYQSSVLPNSIPTNNQNCEVTVSPNPTSALFHIDAGNCFNGKLNFTLYSIDGRIILQTQAENSSFNLNVSNLNKGIYLGVIEKDGNKVVQRMAIVK